jgi:hypothetical protein
VTPRDEDVFDGRHPSVGGRVVLLGAPVAVMVAVAWKAARETWSDGARVEPLATAGVMLGLSALLLTPTLWMERHRVLRLAFFPGGFAGITIGGRRFSMSWRDVRESSVEYRVAIGRIEPRRRAVRVDTTTGPLLLTDSLPRFDVLVARLHAATPHAFHQALPSWFERVVLNVKPPLTPPPGAPGSGSASA